jgi:hypothetical protein
LSDYLILTDEELAAKREVRKLKQLKKTVDSAESTGKKAVSGPKAARNGQFDPSTFILLY